MVNNKCSRLFIIIMLMFVFQCKASRGFATSRYSHHFKTFSSEYWIIVKKDINDSLLKGNSGLQIKNKLVKANDTLDKLACMKYSPSDKEKVKEFLVICLNNFIHNQRFIELAKSEKRKVIEKKGYLSADGKHRIKCTGGGPYDIIMDFPKHILRTLSCLEPSKKQIDTCLDILMKTSDKETRNGYIVAFFSFIVKNSPPDIALSCIGSFNTEKLSEKTRKRLEQLKIASIVRGNGINKTFQAMLNEFCLISPSNRLLLENCFNKYSYGFGFIYPKIKKEYVKKLFDNANNNTEKFVILCISLGFCKTSYFDTAKYGSFLKDIKVKELNEKEKYLYHKAYNIYKFYNNQKIR